MNNSPREEQIYAAALELPADQRAAFLTQACAGDDALRARVEALLKANDEADDFFHAVAVVRPAAIVHEKPGDRIGRYKLLQKIGEGGCGVVYMAEQEEPVRRRVALKVIKLGMDTKAVIARFEAERQALALMEHPNIARVLDAGATETGRPYFVMELVRGIPITRYCDEENLSTEERLRLFIQVCHAIQHAHQKGIVHRDIKPSNILVTMHDDVAVPKVIDFGIAKATLGRLTDRTVFTAFEQFMGTPAYMSPEQAQFNDIDVDARSDIYSLGVLLYELLAGRPPFDPKTLQQQGIDEIRRIIREVEPPRPSLKLSTLTDADRSTIAKARRTAPHELSSTLRGDLDWIAMKALEKNRTRRYDSANSLAADISRHLSNEPVIARPPSAIYRARKFAARHRFAVASAAVATVALATGLILSRAFLSPASVRPVAQIRRPSDTPAIRKLPLPNAGWVVSSSQDGHYVAYYPAEDSNLFIYDVATGKSRRTLECNDNNGPWGLSFSPDNAQIAYDTAGRSICVANLDGSGVRQLLKPEKDVYFGVVGWSPWLSGLLVVAEKSGENHFFSIDPKTGEQKALSLPTKKSRWRLSADGRFLARQNEDHGLSLLDIASGHEETTPAPVTSVAGWSWSTSGVIGWARADSELIFHSDRTGGNSLWAIAVKDGKFVAEPRLVREYRDEIRIISVTRDGTIFYTEQKNTSNICLASANFETGDVTEPRLVTERFPGVQTEPTWSSNGKKLWLAIQGEQRRLLGIFPSSGKEEEFSAVKTLRSPLRQFSWSQDGSFVLLQARRINGPDGIQRWEPASDKVTTIVTRPKGGWASYPRLTPDEKSFYFVDRKFYTNPDNTDNWSDRIVRRDLETRQDTVVYDRNKVQIHCPYEPSPEGTRLAIVTSDPLPADDFVVGIRILDLRSGAERELLRFPSRENIISLAWTPDGKRIVYIKSTPKPGLPDESALWSTSVESVNPTRIKFADPHMRRFALHPNGKDIAFATGAMGESNDIWLMEGVIPAPVKENRTVTRPMLSASTVRRSIPVAELIQSAGTLQDKETGISANLPSGWTIKSAERGKPSDVQLMVRLTNPALPESILLLSQHIIDTKLPPKNEADAWLRHWKDTTLVEMRSGMSTIANHRTRPDSLASIRVADHPALKWSGDFQNNGANWAEHAVVIHCENGPIFVRVVGPTAEVEKARPAFEAFVETIQLP